jgi:dTDP-4-amino-4,6-dideoxygalactose transaminase
VKAPALAILGGLPAFSTPRHVGAPFLPPRQGLHAALDALLDSGWLTNGGPCVHRLETLLAARHGVSQAVAVANGTLALQLVFRALGLRGEILLPAFTFIATAHAATWERLDTRFVDIDRATHCLDPRAAAEALGESTAALVGVHLWGQRCDVEGLGRIASRAGIPLILDGAQGLGIPMEASAGALACVLSLHATKIVSGLEGGAVLTNDGALAADLRRMRNFGFAGYDKVVGLGTNAKLNEFSATFALQALTCLDSLIQRNRIIREEYKACLQDLPGITFHAPLNADSINHHYAVVMVDPQQCPLTRDELMHVLWAENILARRYFHPGCHRMEPYRRRAAADPPVLPVTEAVAASVLVLPAGSAVRRTEVGTIGERMRQALDQAPLVRANLPAGSIA